MCTYIVSYRHTSTAHVLHIYMGLAQGHHNKVHDSGEQQSNNASPTGQLTALQEWDGAGLRHDMVDHLLGPLTSFSIICV